MRIQAYTAYTGTLTITVATPRPEEAASAFFVAGKIHEDYCAKVRAALEEHIHILAPGQQFPAAQQLQTYFPAATVGGVAQPLYALRELMPAGSPRDVDMDFFLEIMRIRYAFTLVLLPAAFAASGVLREGKERHLEYAVKKLFEAQSIPHTTIPGDNDILDGVSSHIGILCELGAASARQGVDIPQPT